MRTNSVIVYFTFTLQKDSQSRMQCLTLEFHVIQICIYIYCKHSCDSYTVCVRIYILCYTFFCYITLKKY